MGNWALKVNVAGVAPFEPGAFQRFPEGAYAVLITDSDLKQAKDPGGAPNLIFDVKIVEAGAAQGVTTKLYVGTDWSKEGNKKHMRALLLGVGASPAILDNGEVDLAASMFVGKTAFIYNETREGKDEQGRALLDNRNFVAPAWYEKKKTEMAQAKPAGPAANGGAPAGLAGLAGAQATPAIGGAPTPGAGFPGGALFGAR